MLPRGDQSLQYQILELGVSRRLIAAHDLDEFGRQLERAGLEAEIAGRRRQHEAEVDVYDVAVAVQQDVAVVAILDLDEIADEAVGRAALDEIFLGHEEALGTDGPEFPLEVLQQSQLAELLHLVQGHGVEDRLDQAAVVRQAEDSAEENGEHDE